MSLDDRDRPPERPRVCVVGHVTKDRITIPGREDRVMPGGSAFYSAIAYASLGAEVTVVTRLARADERRLLGELREAGVRVVTRPSPRTTEFHNIYHDAELAVRSQEVPAVASPFAPRDLDGIEADILHLGPLTVDELPQPVVEAAARRGGLLALDVQGYTRAVAGGTVRPTRAPGLPAILARITVLKADEEEAEIVTGKTDPMAAARALSGLGVREVLITAADRGSLVCGPEGFLRIRAIPPRRLVDATGCGDSYLSGYLMHRQASSDVDAAARFATAVATLKLETQGPFRSSAADAKQRAEAAAGVLPAP